MRCNRLLVGAALAVLLLVSPGVPQPGIAGHEVISFLNQVTRAPVQALRAEPSLK
jgi:hypothetical protein